MCLLSFHDEQVVADYEAMRVGAINNADGFGFAVHTGDEILRGRGLEFERVYADYVSVMRSGGVSMFHHRWATHGAVNKKNCHPFLVGGDNRTVLGHNGILAVEIPLGDKRSDTRLFADKVFPDLGGVLSLEGETLRPDVARAVGDNKLVVLTTDKRSSADWFIVNERLGHWVGRSWFSNYSYEPYTPYKYLSTYSSSPDLGYRQVISECEQCPTCWDWFDFVDESEIFMGCPVCQSCFFCGEVLSLCQCEVEE